MKIILSPAKKMITDTDSIAPDGLPEFIEKTTEIQKMCIRDRHTQHVNVSNTAEVMDKLSKHEIDCFVSVEEPRWEESEISPITSIGAVSYTHL